jgi:hypothetical protein
MKPEIRDRWTAALRSGEYEQGRRRLRTNGDRFCCLGVLCDVVGVDLDPWADATGVALAPPILEALIPYEVRNALASKNDAGGAFAEIADWIDEHIRTEL